MSQCLMVRWFGDGDHRSAGALFTQLTECVEAWESKRDAWESARIRDGLNHNVRLQSRETWTLAELHKVAAWKKTPADGSIFASVPIACRRNEGDTMVDGWGCLDVECWNEEHACRQYDISLGGRAELSITPAEAYVPLHDATKHPAREAYNRGVADNIEALRTLLVRVIETTRPSSLKLFTEGGWDLPFNAHATWFADESALLDDLAVIQRLWDEGLETYPVTPPLKTFDSQQQRLAWHTSRSTVAQHALWQDFARLLPAANQVTPEGVRETLDTTTLDVQRIGDGWLLGNQPYLTDKFVAQIYLEVLENAQGPA
ncbi:hypothetical protein AB1L30_14140 [Bremerella sp. JC817]|uniref:hypothetical protein n=1 Tax=Bremerella sp. JC817 TaxID=3231756 RepID=UPI00345B1DCA